MEFVIKPVVPAKYLDDKTIFHLNPSGRYGSMHFQSAPCNYVTDTQNISCLCLVCVDLNLVPAWHSARYASCLDQPGLLYLQILCMFHLVSVQVVLL